MAGGTGAQRGPESPRVTQSHGDVQPQHPRAVGEPAPAHGLVVSSRRAGFISQPCCGAVAREGCAGLGVCVVSLTGAGERELGDVPSDPTAEKAWAASRWWG